MKTLASLAAVLIAAAAPASAQEARIQWGDLDLSTAAGAAAFDARVQDAARNMCRNARLTGSQISRRADCQAAVRDEAIARLPGAARADYALGRTSLAV